jgi:hypothetical protein
MGLLDRAFGVDKNSMLFNRLAFHWRAVASHYENCVAKKVSTEEKMAVMRKIQNQSSNFADRINDSKKGFGVISVDFESLRQEMKLLMELHSQIDVPTEKHHWLPEVIVATTDILSGNKKSYQNRQYWFSD